MFGDTPDGIILLDFILLAMGLVLSPLLWGIFKRLGEIASKLSECVTNLAATQSTLAEVVKELNEAHIRDTKMEGRMKGIERQIGLCKDAD